MATLAIPTPHTLTAADADALVDRQLALLAVDRDAARELDRTFDASFDVLERALVCGRADLTDRQAAAIAALRAGLTDRLADSRR